MGEDSIGRGVDSVDSGDPVARQLRSDIKEYGWHVIEVLGDDEVRPWAYSVGVYQSYGHPEIVIFGLDHDVMFGMISAIIDEIKAGVVYRDGDETPEILEGYNCMFRIVGHQWYAPFFGRAIDYYGGSTFPVLQCVWPDRHGLYPWSDNSDFEGDLQGTQPLLFSVTMSET